MNNFKSKILIFAIIFVPITISLGIWQIERADEKKLIIANYDKLLVTAPVALQKNENFHLMINYNWEGVIYDHNFIRKVNNFKSGFDKFIILFVS